MDTGAVRWLRVLFFLGRPLAPIYGVLMALRAWLYKTGFFRRHRLAARVISIGNLTMGGTGKTPMTMYIAGYLREKGKKVAIVSRGYGGRARNSVNVVSDGREICMTAVDSGDEPLLLAENLPGIPVLTGKKRAVTGQYAVEKFGIDTIVMDDGFQHLAVERDLDLVLFNGRVSEPCNFLRSSRVLPGGDLREFPGALQRAHAFVITGWNESTADNIRFLKGLLGKRFPGKPVFTGKYRAVGLMNCTTGKTVDLHEAGSLAFYAFCGIADPGSFRRTIDDEHLKVTGFRAYSDHYAYNAPDFAALQKEAASTGAEAFLTTEKDFVKLRPLLDGPLPVFSLKVELDMDKEFEAFLDKRLAV